MLLSFHSYDYGDGKWRALILKKLLRLCIHLRQWSMLKSEISLQIVEKRIKPQCLWQSKVKNLTGMIL